MYISPQFRQKKETAIQMLNSLMPRAQKSQSQSTFDFGINRSDISHFVELGRCLWTKCQNVIIPKNYGMLEICFKGHNTFFPIPMRQFWMALKNYVSGRVVASPWTHPHRTRKRGRWKNERHGCRNPAILEVMPLPVSLWWEEVMYERGGENPRILEATEACSTAEIHGATKDVINLFRMPDQRNI